VTAIDDFFTHYYARRPVNATFTGVHAYDDCLPDWSPDGLAAMDGEMRSLGEALAREYPSQQMRIVQEGLEKEDLLAAA